MLYDSIVFKKHYMIEGFDVLINGINAIRRTFVFFKFVNFNETSYFLKFVNLLLWQASILTGIACVYGLHGIRCQFYKLYFFEFQS